MSLTISHRHGVTSLLIIRKEIHYVLSVAVQVCSGFGAVTDHIIGLKYGGSVYDDRNLQNLCKKHDQEKRAMESHGYIIPGIHTDDGIIPAYSVENDIDIDIHIMPWEECYTLISNTYEDTFIIGKPASGKSYITEAIRNVIHTDDYIDDVAGLISRINGSDRYIVEGNLCYTIINKINRKPAKIIELFIDNTQVFKVYKQQRRMRSALFALSHHYIREKELYDYLNTGQCNSLFIRVLNNNYAGGH
jgi:hypothetical protein